MRRRTESAPAGNRGLTTTTEMESKMASPKHTYIPPTRALRADCGDAQPHGWYRCNRPAEHGGRHNFSWRHLDGRVRAVWA